MNRSLLARHRATLWATPLLLLAALGCGDDDDDKGAAGSSGGTPAGGAGGVAASGGAGQGGVAGQGGGGAAAGGGAGGQGGAPACDGSALCVQSLSLAKGFVNGGVYVTVKGTGFTSGARVFIGDGRAPARVVDATTLVALVPPGPVGSHDVRVTQGSVSATLANAFAYQTASVGGTWSQVPMNEGRGSFPSVTLLQDGRVLIAGGGHGDGSPDSNTAELYDPQHPAETKLAANTMSVARRFTAAVALLDGRVLIAGNCHQPVCTKDADGKPKGDVDVFDPTTNQFSPVGKLLDTTRAPVRLTLLPDGRALVTSGLSAGPVETPATSGHNPTAEIFDPTTNTLTAAKFTSKNPGFGRPVRLRDGRILFVSSLPDVAEVLDPDTDTLTQLTSNFTHAPEFYGPMLPVLPDGRVARIAGADFTPDAKNPGQYYYAQVASIETFDPATNAFTQLASSLTQQRLHNAWSVMRDGSVFVMAGYINPLSSQLGCDPSAGFTLSYSVEQVLSGLSSVAAFPSLPTGVDTSATGTASLVATTLNDGSMIVAGGSNCTGKGSFDKLYFLQAPTIN